MQNRNKSSLLFLRVICIFAMLVNTFWYSFTFADDAQALLEASIEQELQEEQEQQEQAEFIKENGWIIIDIPAIPWENIPVEDNGLESISSTWDVQEWIEEKESVESWTWSTGTGKIAVENWTWSTGTGEIVIENWTWSTGTGEIVIESWTWSTGTGEIVVESWTWNTGTGEIEVENWTWSTGTGEIVIESWTWSTGTGEIAVESWTWSTGTGEIVIESWTWSTGTGETAVESWTWSTGTGEIAVENWTLSTGTGEILSLEPEVLEAISVVDVRTIHGRWLRMLAWPWPHYPTVTTIPNTTRIEVYDHEWLRYKVKYAGNVWWISSANTEHISSQVYDDTPDQTYSPTVQYPTTGSVITDDGFINESMFYSVTVDDSQDPTVTYCSLITRHNLARLTGKSFDFGFFPTTETISQGNANSLIMEWLHTQTLQELTFSYEEITSSLEEWSEGILGSSVFDVYIYTPEHLVDTWSIGIREAHRFLIFNNQDGEWFALDTIRGSKSETAQPLQDYLDDIRTWSTSLLYVFPKPLVTSVEPEPVINEEMQWVVRVGVNDAWFSPLYTSPRISSLVVDTVPIHTELMVSGVTENNKWYRVEYQWQKWRIQKVNTEMICLYRRCVNSMSCWILGWKE